MSRLPQDAKTLQLTLLQADLDDESPEVLGDFLASVLDSGALDAVAVPLIMKKGRPGVRLEILAPPEREEALAARLLRETSTLGVRRIAVTRTGLERREEHVEVDGQKIAVKLALWNGKAFKAKPELEDCRAAARATGRSLRDVRLAAEAEARALLAS